MRWTIIFLLISCSSTTKNIRSTKDFAPVESVYKIETYKYNSLRGSATAFAIKVVNDTTFILTNRHVCHEQNNVEYVLIDSSGKRYDAKYYRNHLFADLCLLKVGYILPTLELAYSQFNEHVTTIGAPHGAFPIYENGIIKQFVTINQTIKGENYFFTAQVIKVNTEEGGSGSPIFNNDKHVVGILFGTIDGNYSLMVPAQKVRQFIEHIDS
jgi:S1-C subfamily serine protease